MTTQLVLLAGGLATRLGNRTSEIPKSLIEISGKKFIDYQLSQFSRLGFREVLICVGHLGHQIIDFVGDGKKWGLKIEYSREEGELLGTGGALQLALPKLKEQFCLVYGDSYLLTDLLKITEEARDLGVRNMMTIYRNIDGTDQSNVEFENPNHWRYSKSKKLISPNFIDYGFLVLNRDDLALFRRKGKWDLSEYLEELNIHGALTPYIATEKYYEIGSEDGINSFSKIVQ